MKETEIFAYKESKKFTESHEKRIFTGLKKPYNAPELSEITGLSKTQILRRTGKMENELKIFVAGTKDGYSIFARTPPQTELTHVIAQDTKDRVLYHQELKRS